MIVGIITAVILIGVAGTIGYGALHWARASARLADRLSAPVDRSEPIEAHRQTVSFADELPGLPEPVQRYFRTVLTDGQPMIHGLRMNQRGTFNMGQGETDQWKPFTAEQIVRPGHPGFLWNARIRMLPILSARVHDAYVDGGGLLHGALFGAVTVMEARGTREIARGELLRFLAESPWYPTALLPSQGIRWEAVDESSARVTLTDPNARGGPLDVTMLFRFDSDGTVESVYAEERDAEVDGEFIPTPWEGRWRAYTEHSGMVIPTEGEVAWLFPERRKTYWRGTVTNIAFEFAPAR